MRTIKLTIAATETHCEHNGALCEFMEFEGSGAQCLAFDGASEELVMDTEMAGYLRLPECIAAEEALGR
jgi:hypothetical protein